MNNNLMKALGSKQGLVGALAFLLPFLSLVTLWGVGLCSFIFFLAALYHFKACRSALTRHWAQLRWVIGAFVLFALFALATLLIHPGTSTSSVEKPLRMLLAVSALGLVLAFRPDRRFLWAGAAGGAVLGAVLVGYQRFAYDWDRPGGILNAIVTGDILLMFGLMCLAALIDMRAARQRIWPALGAAAGFAGSMMTGTRGSWAALALAAIVFILYGHMLRSPRVRAIVLAAFLLTGASYFVPQTGMRERVDQGVADVTAYYEGGSAYSNVGIRLALWKGAFMMIGERPLLGIGHPEWKFDMARRVREGTLDEVVLPAEHLHNDMLHVLVVGGLAAFVAWLAILAAPLAFFSRMLRAREGAAVELHALALAGMLVVLSYFAFGLTEVIFWSTKASMLYALTVFILIGLCLNAKEHDGK